MALVLFECFRFHEVNGHKGNETAIKSDEWDITNTAIATAIALIMDAVLTSDSGDGTATKPDYLKELVEALPAIFAAFNAGRKTLSLRNNLSARDGYMLALSSAVSSLDYIISENKKAFDFYESEYDVYVTAMANHGGGIVREPNYSGSTNYTAQDIEVIKTTVKSKNAFNSDPTNQQNNMLKFWYHIAELKSTSMPTSKPFERFEDFDTFWKLDPLPKKYKCGGGCGQKYRTPVEQLVTCPYPLTSSTLVAGNKTLNNLPTDANLNGKPAPAGCGHMFYLCSVDDRNEHCVRVCGKLLPNGNKCGALYRNCTNTKIKHKGNLPGIDTSHGPGKGGLKVGPGPAPGDLRFNSISPSEPGVYTAGAGGNHTANVSVPSGWTQIYWYLKSPSESGLGTSQLPISEDSTGNSTTASYTYSFPEGVSGDYVLTAYVYLSDNTIVQPSYTVSVSLPSSTDTTTTSTESTTSTSTPAAPASAVTVTISPGAGYTSTAQAGRSYSLTASVSEQIYGIKWYWKPPGSTEMLYNSNTFYSSVTTSDNLYLSFDGPNPTEYVGTHEFRVEVTLTNYDTHEASYTLTVVSNP